MYALLLLFVSVTAKTYSITFPSLGPFGGAPGNTFYGRLENTDGATTEVFQFTGTCLEQAANAPCNYTPDLTDIDSVSSLKYLYMMTRGSNALLVDEIQVDSWFVDESLSVTTFEYTEFGSYPEGCEVLVVDLPGDDIITRTETPTCVTFPPTPEPTSSPTLLPPTSSPSRAGDIVYDVDIILPLEGGSTDDFYLVIKGVSGETTPYLINDMTDGPNTYAYQFIDVDVGTVTYAYLVSYGSDTLAVTEIVVNSVYSISELLPNLLSYSDDNSFGCKVLIADFASDEITVTQQKPCVVIAPDYGSQNEVNTAFRIYSIQIKVFNEGGSVNDIFAAIEGIEGNRTTFINIGKLSNAGFSGTLFERDLNVTNVGLASKLYLLNYGNDALLVEGCSIDDASYYYTPLALEYNGYDPRGCDMIICDVISDDMLIEEQVPCLNYENIFNINDTRTYSVDIDIQIEGGSVDDTYIIIQGLSGRRSDPYNAGAMTNGDTTYTFNIETSDVGDVKALFLVKLGSDGDDALFVEACTADDIYSISEVTGDLLQYTGSDARGCGYVKCDFINDKMSTNEQDVCNIIPFISEISNGTTAEYFVNVDTTNIPFSTPGGTEDEIWLRISNTDGKTSEFVNLGTDMSDDGEIYTFRVNVSNLGADISNIQFIQFGDDDFCIDFCQINEQSIDLGLFGSECNENDVDDNDACAIMTCDFESDSITSIIETPCKQDVYGWNNKTYRSYTIVIDVCESVGEIIDTWSMDSFWIYLENVDLDLLSESFKVDALGTDGDNIVIMNTTNIGAPDKLYLIHYNNDDVCITDISVDGFKVTSYPWTASEYDCDYSDKGCNVLTVDFETNEMSIESKKECPFTPSDLDAVNDTCLEDIVQNWYDELFELSTMIGIISLIVIIVIGLCCFGCCIWLCCYLQKSKSKIEAMEMKSVVSTSKQDTFNI